MKNTRLFNRHFFIIVAAISNTTVANEPSQQWTFPSYREIAPSISSNNVQATNYTFFADSINFSDNSMALGDIFATSFQLGTDSKIYGNVDILGECNLRTRSHINGDLRYKTPCITQTGATLNSSKQVSLSKPSATYPSIAFNDSAKALNISKSETLPPGEYGPLSVKKHTKIKLSSGSYKFQSILTDPNVQLTFDLTAGPVKIDIAGDVRFGNKSLFAIKGGNPSEITWNIAGKSIEMGTDGLYFGTIIAPKALVSIESRTHLVGSVYANKLTVAPKSTISREPRAEEISHSEEHFGPFFEPNTFHYRSVLPTTTKTVEMYVYAKNSKVKINGKESTKIDFGTSSTTVNIAIFRDKITGFPAEAFSSNYVFNFEKNDNYRIYWNPQSPCSQECDGSTPATAIGNFNAVLETAQKTGREINITSGTWNVAENFAESAVPWKVGFELVGYTGNIWQLKSENDMPLIDLSKSAHIEIEGRSPRSLRGLRIAHGFNKANGGAIYASNQKFTIKNAIFSDAKSNVEGGAIYASDTLNLENVRFSGNSSLGDGGAVAVNGETKMLNVVYTGNKAAKNGGAIKLTGNAAYIGNGVFHDNQAVTKGGAIINEANKLDIWNSTFFANIAKVANPAVGGKSSGTIGNSIFWKNYTPSCEPGKCANEVIEGFAATHSSFSRPYGGNHNYAGDPKFKDEKSPAGNNTFWKYDAGLNISADSPLRKAGKKDNKMPIADITGSERDEKELTLGAYVFYVSTFEVFYGELQEDGTIGAATPMIPLANEIPNDWMRSFFANSNYARAIKVKITKHSRNDVSSIKVRFTLIKNDKTPYGFKPVEFELYRNGEENGKYVFQTETNTQGKPVLFSQDPSNIGNYDDAIILCIKKGSDRFHYDILNQ